VGGFSPTTRWRQGELVADTHRIPLPAGLPAGDYSIKAGLYEPGDTLRNLAPDPPAPDNRVGVGVWTVE
jgi:hypothetical protein